MSCENLIEHLGFECRQIDSSVISVSTSFSFADGEIINFYIQDKREEVVVTDNGDTLFHLRGVGLDLSDRRRWRPYRQIVAAHGFELEDSGVIIGKSSTNQVSQLVANYISAMLDIVNLEHEQLGIPEEIDHFIEEVEFYLRAWKPSGNIVRLPVLTGMSGKSHTFHFELDGTLIDAAKPNSNKTGALLRKLTDISLAGLNRSSIVVMDDREDPERAEIETKILTSMTAVLSFGQLIRNAGNLLEMH